PTTGGAGGRLGITRSGRAPLAEEDLGGVLLGAAAPHAIPRAGAELHLGVDGALRAAREREGDVRLDLDRELAVPDAGAVLGGLVRVLPCAGLGLLPVGSRGQD